VLTVSRKSERLVNLTIALLATKRWLTKAEIFASVAGYSGDSEAKDRMFERDKDDLRSLGINIELGTFDPLFEDEAGYRIKPESYALQLHDLDATQLALLSQAARYWQEAALGDSAQSGLRKLKGLGIESDLDTFIDISTALKSTPEQIPDLIEAVSTRTAIRFEYLDENMESKVRNIQPYRLSNTRGYWYLIGNDLDRSALRTFRVDRINSTISSVGRPGSYEVDKALLQVEEEKYSAQQKSAVVAIRKGKAQSLRTGAVITEKNADWDLCTISYRSDENLLQRVLWYGTDVVIEEPKYLREEIIARLEKAVQLHG
jgi:proteasome accessory factor B